MTIYLDFDGTVVEHKYPKIGKLLDNTIPVIKQLLEKHNVILNTYRVEISNSSLREATDFLVSHNICPKSLTYFKFIPEVWNLDKDVIYIDDITPNIPLKNGSVDWTEVEKQLKEKGIL